MIFLFQNITLLITLVVVYIYLIQRLDSNSTSYFLLSGILFGTVAVLGMMMPLEIGEGAIFDGRSVIISISGIYGGPITAFTAAIIASIYRIMIGGVGKVVGVFTIFQAGFFGVIFHYLVKNKIIAKTTTSIFLLSLGIHIVMIISFLFVPSLDDKTILNVLAIPALTIYPIATVIISSLISDQEQKHIINLKIKDSERRLQNANLKLNLAYDATLEGWSKALDLKDHETEGHSLRVTDRTIILANILGVSDEELVHIRRGALLHDIGKVGVPDSILLKPDKLDDDEWVVMKQHPTLAYELLNPIDYLKPSLDIPYCHHEKYNGSGYPRGLRGKEIPLAARIFAIIDVYDALTSTRPYRQAWSKKDALKYISDEKGKHFDPDIVDAFLLATSTVS